MKKEIAYGNHNNIRAPSKTKHKDELDTSDYFDRNDETSLMASSVKDNPVISHSDTNIEKDDGMLRIAIIGERHSGTSALYDKISNCFPSIEVSFIKNLFQNAHSFDPRLHIHIIDQDSYSNAQKVIPLQTLKQS